jgi:predicted phosphodiesterase/sugar phosphate isomerase/epimerase
MSFPENLRLFILGDPHIEPSELGLWQETLAQINRLSPDAVLVLGDLTGGKWTGTQEGMTEAVRVLSELKAPWFTIIGNHDLQAAEYATDADAVAGFLSFTNRESPWFSRNIGPLTVIGLSTTRFRDNPVTPHEIVLSDEQLSWFSEELKRNAGRPVLVLCHAPPIGSGLLTLSELHCASGNAYVNQNHVPGRIQRLILDHPNILFWFSGHNHMGQHYRDALTCRVGVHFIHTGVVSKRKSRDGCRHSRVLDISSTQWRISTYDHALGGIDTALDCVVPGGAETWLAYRKMMKGRRRVALDPSTMRQGPGTTTKPAGTVRFAFLSDFHGTRNLTATQKRIIEWCVRQIRASQVDRVILGGDLTHHARWEEAQTFVAELGIEDLPMDYLPGNNEAICLTGETPHFENVRLLTGQLAQQGWAANVFLLATTSGASVQSATQDLTALAPKDGNLLVLSHYPPDLSATAPLLNGRKVFWICGHRHRHEAREEAELEIHVSAGLDAIKVQHQRPELLIVDWNGETAAVQRLEIPEKDLRGSGPFPHFFGLACRGSAEELVTTAIAQDIRAVQFHYSQSRGEPTAAEVAAIQTFRAQFPDSFLSLHLPNLPLPPEGPRLEDVAEWLTWGRAAGVDDLTIHLPKAEAGMLFDEEKNLRDTPWARQCLATYLELAKFCLSSGCGLSLENVYHKKPVQPGEEKLGTRPWHLITLVERLRQELLLAGYSERQTAQVGIIFDAGHAFSDVTVAKEIGLAEWVQALCPYLRLMHIHQVRISDGQKTNHHPITALTEPAINYLGFLATVGSLASKRLPLLIEVRDREAALAGWRTLRSLEGKP